MHHKKQKISSYQPVVCNINEHMSFLAPQLANKPNKNKKSGSFDTSLFKKRYVLKNFFNVIYLNN